MKDDELAQAGVKAWNSGKGRGRPPLLGGDSRSRRPKAEVPLEL